MTLLYEKWALLVIFNTESTQKIDVSTDLISKKTRKECYFLTWWIQWAPFSSQTDKFYCKNYATLNPIHAALIHLPTFVALVGILGFTREDQHHNFKTSLGKQSKKLNKQNVVECSYKNIECGCIYREGGFLKILLH